MDWPMDNDDDPLDRLAEDNANEEALIPEEVDEDQQEMMLDDDDDEDWEAEEEEEEDLYSLGTRFRNIGVRAVFDELRPLNDAEEVAVIVLYLLYPDLRQEIVQELRSWIIISGRSQLWRIQRMFAALGKLDVEEIEQQYGEALLEFLDLLGPLMVEARRNPIPTFMFHAIVFPLHAPLGAMVAAKLLQYAGSVESIRELTLLCEHPYRAFRPDEVERLASSILNLKHLQRLVVLLSCCSESSRTGR